MNDKKVYIDYTINWQQEYPELIEFLEKYAELMVEMSDYKEAKEVIEKIKNTPKE